MYRKFKLLPVFIAFTTSLFVSSVYAAENSSVEFFSSNNDQEITVQQAFIRLTGDQQSELQENIIKIMQKNRMEQGSFEAVLGTYQMSIDKKITADNTEIFFSSPFQILKKEKIFHLANELAKNFNQDSVAVLIPESKEKIVKVKIYFNQNKPSIEQAINIVKKKLPVSYNNAFSLELDRACGGFEKTTVNSIEWIGSHLDVQLIQKAFPQQRVTTQKGTAYLVYKNGKIDKL
jgi:hypothetical protein